MPQVHLSPIVTAVWRSFTSLLPAPRFTELAPAICHRSLANRRSTSRWASGVEAPVSDAPQLTSGPEPPTEAEVIAGDSVQGDVRDGRVA